MLPVGMTNASTANSLSMSTRATTNTTVSNTSRTGSRWGGFLAGGGAADMRRVPGPEDNHQYSTGRRPDFGIW